MHAMTMSNEEAYNRDLAKLSVMFRGREQGV